MAAYTYFRGKHSENEGGGRGLQAARPGDLDDVHTITRASLLNDAEYYEFSQGLQALHAGPLKIISYMIGANRAKLHPMFGSGVTGIPDPVMQDIWWAIRKNPALAHDLQLLGKVVYGRSFDLQQATTEAASLLSAHHQGPSRWLTNELTAAEAKLSLQTGVLPNRSPFLDENGRPQMLQGGLRNHIGYATVVCLHALSASSDCARELSMLKFLVSSQLHPLSPLNSSQYTAAFAARMLLVMPNRFHFTPADVITRLHHPTLTEV